jgi:hypothetical protein
MALQSLSSHTSPTIMSGSCGGGNGGGVPRLNEGKFNSTDFLGFSYEQHSG